jgi:hypothetical protein
MVMAEYVKITNPIVSDIVPLASVISDGAKKQTIVLTLAPKINAFSAQNLAALLPSLENGYNETQKYRDDAAKALAPKVKVIDQKGIVAVVNLISSQEARASVALVLMEKTNVTVDMIVAVSALITDGYDESQKYKTKFDRAAMLLLARQPQ